MQGPEQLCMHRVYLPSISLLEWYKNFSYCRASVCEQCLGTCNRDLVYTVVLTPRNVCFYGCLFKAGKGREALHLLELKDSPGLPLIAASSWGKNLAY